MDYKLEIDSDKRIIRVNAKCALNQNIRKNILKDIAKMLKKYEYSRALIDLTATQFDYHVPLTGASELVAYMGIIGITPQTRLAFIYAEAEPHRKHYQQVCQNSGYDICYFQNLSDALKWLE